MWSSMRAVRHSPPLKVVLCPQVCLLVHPTLAPSSVIRLLRRLHHVHSNPSASFLAHAVAVASPDHPMNLQLAARAQRLRSCLVKYLAPPHLYLPPLQTPPMRLFLPSDLSLGPLSVMHRTRRPSASPSLGVVKKGVDLRHVVCLNACVQVISPNISRPCSQHLWDACVPTIDAIPPRPTLGVPSATTNLSPR